MKFVIKESIVIFQVLFIGILQLLTNWSSKQIDEMQRSVKKLLIIKQICNILCAELRNKLTLFTKLYDFVHHPLIASLECNWKRCIPLVIWGHLIFIKFYDLKLKPRHIIIGSQMKNAIPSFAINYIKVSLMTIVVDNCQFALNGSSHQYFGHGELLGLIVEELFVDS